MHLRVSSRGVPFRHQRALTLEQDASHVLEPHGVLCARLAGVPPRARANPFANGWTHGADPTARNALPFRHVRVQPGSLKLQCNDSCVEPRLIAQHTCAVC